MKEKLKNSKWLEYLTLALVLSLPFERIPSWEVFGYTLKINQFIIIILFIVFIILLVIKKDLKISKNNLIPLIILFLGANLISFTNSIDINRSIIIFLLILFVSLLFIIIPSIVKDEKTLKLISKYLFIITAIICLFGLYQYLGDKWGLSTYWTGLRASYTKDILGFPRIQSTLIEPLYLANFLIIPGSIFLALFLADKLKYNWFILGLFFILLLVVFILTISRSAYLGLAIAFLIIVIFKYKEFFKLKKFSFLISALIFAVLFVMILLGSAGNRFFSHGQTALSTNNQEPSAVERRDTYSIGIKAYKEHPIFGIGIGNYGPYYDNYPTEMPQNGWQTANNEYIEILAETGIFGLATFILLLIVLLIRSWIAYKQTKNIYLSAFVLGSSAALVGILVQYYFFSTLYIIYIWFLLGIIAASQEIIFRQEKNN